MFTKPSHEIGGSGMRAFPVRLPSGARYWTVLDQLMPGAMADSKRASTS
jgi:hypothetical protein